MDRRKVLERSTSYIVISVENEIAQTPYLQVYISLLSPCPCNSHARTHTHIRSQFLVFRCIRKILRKATIRHVHLSVRMEQLGSQWMDFHEI